MKKIILILFVFLGNAIICKAQDTLGNFYYSGFTDSDLFFAKQYKKENIFYNTILNDNRIIINKCLVDSNSLKKIEMEFEPSARGVLFAYSTDSSFIVLLNNKQKDANILKYEFDFATDSFIKTTMQTEVSHSSNTTIASNFINNKKYFYQTNNKTKQLIFNITDFNKKSTIYEFAIDDVIKQTGLKKGEFEAAFLSPKTVLTYEGDKNLLGLSSFYKCYVTNNEAYIISNVLEKNVTNVLHLNFTNKAANYFTLNTKEMSCTRNHYVVRNSFALYNNLIVCSKSCNHNIELFFYTTKGNFIKSYSIDTSFKNVISNYGAYRANYNQDTIIELDNIKKDILNKTDNTTTFYNYVTCYPVNENNFMVVTGYYKGASVGGILLNTAFNMVARAFFTIDIKVIGELGIPIYLLPSSSLFDDNSRYVNKTNYIIGTFDNNTCQESTTIPANFYTDNQKRKKKNSNAVATFMYNGSLYNVLFFTKTEEKNQLLIVKDKLH